MRSRSFRWDVPKVDGVHHRLVDTIGGGFAVARRTRRFWSKDEKRRIVAQTYAPGVSVSQVGRRYDVNANLIFKWRRDPRYRPGRPARRRLAASISCIALFDAEGAAHLRPRFRRRGNAARADPRPAVRRSSRPRNDAVVAVGGLCRRLRTPPRHAPRGCGA
ncbi:MAG: transposase, partial [Rhodospirillaceae bacterium]|nr:transposase [Rhodospirillaceae bacterium]